MRTDQPPDSLSPVGPPPVVIVGAGVGGLSLAARLASRGAPVLVLEKEPGVGGKLRTLEAAGRSIDAGPTVLTMRWVFDELFADCGSSLDDHVKLAPLSTLARHRFRDGSELDLFADRRASRDAIARFAGPREADAFERFCDYSEAIFHAVKEPFLCSPLPGASDLFSIAGLAKLRALSRIDGTRTLWSAVSSFFKDERLRMLFGRYATYCGSSPFQAPATLNVIASVESQGAWVVEGGMKALGVALRNLAERSGARVRTSAPVAEIVTEQGRATGVRLESGELVRASAVVTNGDVSHLGSLLGRAASPLKNLGRGERSLSALVLTMVAEVEPESRYSLEHHNVFFSADYPAEFRDLFERGRLPADPTVYICAQDRGPFGQASGGPERLLILINAPARGDAPGFLTQSERDAWQTTIVDLLRRQGLSLRPHDTVVQAPSDFDRLCPGTGGALYGLASHGMTSAFARPQARTPVPGLYAVGGSAHPGAGVPMVALSASIASRALSQDLGAIFASPTRATPGGTSMASATAAATPLPPSPSWARSSRPATTARGVTPCASPP